MSYPSEGPLHETRITRIVADFLSAQNDVDDIIFENHSGKSEEEVRYLVDIIREIMDENYRRYHYISNHREEVMAEMGEDFRDPIIRAEFAYFYLNYETSDNELMSFLCSDGAYDQVLENAEEKLVEDNDDDDGQA